MRVLRAVGVAVTCVSVSLFPDAETPLCLCHWLSADSTEQATASSSGSAHTKT